MVGGDRCDSGVARQRCRWSAGGGQSVNGSGADKRLVKAAIMPLQVTVSKNLGRIYNDATLP